MGKQCRCLDLIVPKLLQYRSNLTRLSVAAVGCYGKDQQPSAKVVANSWNGATGPFDPSCTSGKTPKSIASDYQCPGCGRRRPARKPGLARLKSRGSTGSRWNGRLLYADFNHPLSPSWPRRGVSKSAKDAGRRLNPKGLIFKWASFRQGSRQSPSGHVPRCPFWKHAGGARRSQSPRARESYRPASARTRR